MIWRRLVDLARRKRLDVELEAELAHHFEAFRRLLFGRGAVMIAVGLAVGLLGGALTTRYLGSLLFGIQPTDPLTYIGVATLLATVSLLALYVPAGRATKVNPLVALRYE